ncbi:MAG: hypothetical protein HQL54_10190 [Magnetococcales bacterium]|nr:hypothetical protein [Magnetococcales bacterium]
MATLKDSFAEGLENQIAIVLATSEYDGLSDRQKAEILALSCNRLIRTKWVDEHVIATDLMLIRHEKPEMFVVADVER